MATQSESRTARTSGKVLVSRCLNGPGIRYNGTSVDVDSPIWDRWVAEDRLVPFCAELAAGFAVPRPPAEIIGGEGGDVIAGRGIVVEDTGNDVTERFLTGARLALDHAVASGCVAAVLTDGSPSCGSTYTYDGSFDGTTLAGMGVVARLLADHGIRVFPESRLDEADEYVRSLDR